MLIEQKLLEKLRPHAKRINDGTGNDFDFFPAVLLQMLEEQKNLGNAAEAFAAATDQKCKSYDSQLANLIGGVEKNNARAMELAGQITKTEKGQNEKMLALEQAIANLSAASVIEHRKTRKFLIAATVALVFGFGACIVLLMRH